MRNVALVTGGARRLGAVMTQALAESGWEVIIHYNQSEQEAIKLSYELSQSYTDRSFSVIQFDLSNWKEVDQLWSKVVATGLKPNLLINNASVFLPSSLLDTTPEFMEQMMSVNFYTPLFLAQYFASHVEEGHVINILDAAVTTNQSSHGAYLLAKKALAEFTKMAALEWAPQIRVNAVAPGPVLPPPGEDELYLKKITQKTPLAKVVETASIVTAIQYLINNPNTTGETLFCDSGQHLL